jgi:hypothetical protein
MTRRLAVLLVPLLAAGCALQGTVPSAHLDAGAPELRDCAAWFSDLDARVDAAGVRDAQEARLPGFPYLRVNRLLASFRDAAGADESVLHALVDRMQELDFEARRHEIANLPPGPRPPLERARECSARLRQADLAEPRLRARLLERAVVPDDYSAAQRVLGLYTLTKLPFIAGVRRYEEEVRQAFARRLTPPPESLVVRYAPRLAGTRVAAPAVANALAMTEPRGAALGQLLAAHAPVFEIEVAGGYDRPGALRWRADEDLPAVDASEPVVYAHPAWTRYRGRTLLQLVYTVWFAERPPASPGDLLAGRLDGVTWRVTLAPDGEPLLYDTMHPCGCFHMFFPTPRATPLPPPSALQEWNFSPQSLARVDEGERPLLRVAARTHYVERVGATRDAAGDVRYALRDYGELRSLALPGGGRKSVFGTDGLIAGSERPERFLYWPMGIPSAGAMRQWGRHATAFVGRRHFDDADLLEKRFALDLP